MARLFSGEKEQIGDELYWLIRRHYYGLREQEIAELTQMERRRLNNYLRDLETDQKIYKDGLEWHAG